MDTNSSVMLSIIIPHYNSPNTLARLLNTISIHDDIEVIVIDDNSDKYLNELQECKEKYSRYPNCIFAENNTGYKGAGAARNVGINLSKGKWLLFADADDLFVGDLYNTVSRHFDSSVDIVYFKPSMTSDTFDGKINVRKSVGYLGGICKAYLDNYKWSNSLIRFRWYAPWSKMIRHSLVIDNSIMFDNTRYSNDVMFSTQCGYYAKSIDVDMNGIYFVTSTPGSLTSISSEESFFIRREVSCRNKVFIKEHLSEQEQKYLASVGSLRMVANIIQRGYGLRGIKRYYGMRRKYGLSTFPIHLFTIALIQYQLKKCIKSI